MMADLANAKMAFRNLFLWNNGQDGKKGEK